MAFVLGLSAAVFGKFVDSAVRLLIDIVMGIPHMLLLILISFACGRGFWGVVCGIAFTHWASLAQLSARTCHVPSSPFQKDIVYTVPDFFSQNPS